MTHKSTKTYGHEQGWSCAFRQWRATSHCNKLHGYALSIHIEFEADELDERGWVVDFGGLKPVKARLESLYDHKTVIAGDDPDLNYFQTMDGLGLLDLRIAPDGVGCEAFAKEAFMVVDQWLKEAGLAPRVRINHVRVAEHPGNSGIYAPSAC